MSTVKVVRLEVEATPSFVHQSPKGSLMRSTESGACFEVVRWLNRSPGKWTLWAKRAVDG
jgi:hypothetical protein